MDRTEWAKMLPIITAFVEGKRVEYKSFDEDGNEKWVECDRFSFSGDAGDYRIIEHVPHTMKTFLEDRAHLMVIVHTKSGTCCSVKSVTGSGVNIFVFQENRVLNPICQQVSYENLLKHYSFLDGTIVGRKLTYQHG